MFFSVCLVIWAIMFVCWLVSICVPVLREVYLFAYFSALMCIVVCIMVGYLICTN